MLRQAQPLNEIPGLLRTKTGEVARSKMLYNSVLFGLGSGVLNGLE
jgi:hypothetical protein